MLLPHSYLDYLDILVIGDIHYPEAKALRDADIKDASFPTGVLNSVSTPRLQKVVREANKHSVNASIVLGDLTSRGQLAPYQECLTFLHTALNWSDTSRFPNEAIHIVPGNHDINRALVDGSGSQYAVLKSALDEINRGDVLPIPRPRASTITAAGGGVASIFSINSCVGCGTHRGFPATLRTALLPVITDTTAFDAAYEGLDTPGFDEANIDEVVSAIADLPRKVIPIIAFHHNLLPQYLPRIAPYTEVINGGHFRARLLDIKRPVIAIHGHIHQSIAEQVLSVNGGRIICVSAPEFTSGFDTLRIHFSNESFPLGCSLNSFRFQADGTTTSFNRRLPLVQVSAPAFLMTERNRQLIAATTADYQSLASVRLQLNTNAGASFQTRTVAAIAEELEWLGLVEIVDREYEPRSWQIRKLIYA